VDSYTRRYKKAEEEYLTAIRLNPNHATAHHWYGVQLRGWNRMEEAGTELRQAESLDPLSGIIKLNVVTWMAYSRQYPPALEQCDRYLQAFPEFGLLHAVRSWLLERLGRYPEALKEILIAREAFSSSPYFLGQLGFVYSRSGDVGNARRVLAELESWKAKGYAVRADLLQLYVGLREWDHALEQLEEGYAKDDFFPDLLVDPTFDELRPLPRFQEVLRKFDLQK
jgi:tetratricopeptide (TPR) repeat protein